MKIVRFNVKNLLNLERYLREKGYRVEHGPHIVLLDQSELSSIKVLDSVGKEVCIMITHYVTPFYRVELSNITNDDEYWAKLWEIKRSGEYWAIPVNPIIAVVFEQTFLDTIEQYRDEYPVNDGEHIVNEYRRRNPNYKNVPNTLLARILDELG